MLLALALVVAPGVSISSGQPPAASEDVVFVGAGDIANCELLSGATATAALLDGIEGTIFTLGDHAYANGTKAEFAKCYGPTWGRHKARTRPTPGNHDYLTERGRPYFDYFGDAAGSREKGYYSFDLGAWHIISLNSSFPSACRHRCDGCARILRPIRSTASWPTGTNRCSARVRTRRRDDAGAVVDPVQGGRRCRHERPRPSVRAIRPSGRPGTAGRRRDSTIHRRHGWRRRYKFGRVAANSEVRDNTSYGVLKLTLSTGRYAWEFVPTPGSRFRDSGTGTCSPQRPSGP